MTKNVTKEIKNKISYINKKNSSARKQIFAGRNEKISAYSEVYDILKKCDSEKYEEACKKISKSKWNKNNLPKSVVDMVFYMENASENHKRFTQRVTRVMKNLIDTNVKPKDAFKYMKKNTLKKLYTKNAGKKSDFKPNSKKTVKGIYQSILLTDGNESYLVGNKNKKEAIECFKKYQTNTKIHLISYDEKKEVKNGVYKIIETLLSPNLEKEIKGLINEN